MTTTETVLLWINNVEPMYKHWTDQARRLDAHQLAAALKDYYVYANNPLNNDASVYSDLLKAALLSVDWQSIAADLK